MKLRMKYHITGRIKPKTIIDAVVMSEELKKQMDRRTVTMKKERLFGNEIKIFIHPFFPDDFVLMGNEEILRQEGII